MKARARYLTALSGIPPRPQPFGAFAVPDEIITRFRAERVWTGDDLELEETKPLGAAAPEEKL